MSKPARYKKKPVEVQDFDLDFSDYLEYHNDAPQSVAVVVQDGITVDSYSMNGPVFKAFVSGGMSGRTYKVSAILTTLGGRVKQGDMFIRVKL